MFLIGLVCFDIQALNRLLMGSVPVYFSYETSTGHYRSVRKRQNSVIDFKLIEYRDCLWQTPNVTRSH